MYILWIRKGNKESHDLIEPRPRISIPFSCWLGYRNEGFEVKHDIPFILDWYSACNSIVLLIPKGLAWKHYRICFMETNGHLIWKGLRNLCQRLRWSIILIFNTCIGLCCWQESLHIARIPPITVNGASGDRKVNPHCRSLSRVLTSGRNYSDIKCSRGQLFVMFLEIRMIILLPSASGFPFSTCGKMNRS